MTIPQIERAACQLLAGAHTDLDGRHTEADAKILAWRDQIVANPNYVELVGCWSPEPRMESRAIVELCQAVIFFRQEGRPAGDVTRSIGHGLTITTSLAAAVVEFHQAVLGCVAARNEAPDRFTRI